jgi:hypothetical protein
MEIHGPYTAIFEVSTANATDILNSRWDDVSTRPSLEQLSDPLEADVVACEKRLLALLTADATTGVPSKVRWLRQPGRWVWVE